MTKRLFGLIAFSLGFAGFARASDHAEADITKVDLIADLDDLYAWHTSDGKVVVVVTFGGPPAEYVSAPSGLDAAVIYGVHIDTDGDNLPNYDVFVRYAQDPGGAWGVQFTGIPGGSPVVEGPVDTRLDAGAGLAAQAGLFDDPFFFDFTGFLDTLATAAVSFDMSRDTFAAKNVNAFVFELDAATLGSASMRIWATTGRK